MKINEAGLNIIKQFEGCRLESYQDAVGIWTIGWGHTSPDIKEGLQWTQTQCDDALKKDVANTETKIAQALRVKVSDNMFSALVSFAYNIGVLKTTYSTLFKLTQDSRFTEAVVEFSKWNHAGGKVLPGLTARREAEAELFMA